MFCARANPPRHTHHPLRIAMLGFAFTLCGCGASPTIASINNEEVRILANGANLAQAQAKAQEACNLQQRAAKLTGFRCEDRYCVQGIYIFACRLPTDTT